MRSRIPSSLSLGLSAVSLLISLLHFPFLFLFLAAPHQLAKAEPCVAMDANFNLLVFGIDGKDYDAGTEDQWTSSNSAKEITTSGRPLFNGANTTCYLSQYFNAVYVLNGDASNPGTIYIYNAGAQKWSTQNVTDPKSSSATSELDLTKYQAILDHDTNVFYAFSKGQVYLLDMGSLVSANSTALSWKNVGDPQNWITTNDVTTQAMNAYEPVMALAQNHIHFIGVPGLQAGQADIYVIHFSYFQPQAQSYPSSSGSPFPASHGRTSSFFQISGVQQEFAFIPDDGSATYIVNVENNSTQVLAAPSVKDPKAHYFTGVTSLVQLSSSSSTSGGKGSLMFLPYTQGKSNSNAEWTSISALGGVNFAGTASPSGTLAAGHTSGSKSASATGPVNTTSGARAKATLGGTTMAVAGMLFALGINLVAL